MGLRKMRRPTGKACALDMTDTMLDFARDEQRYVGVEDVEFLKSEIRQGPLPAIINMEVIISNGIVNLSSDKERSLAEASLVLSDGGRLAWSDDRGA